MPGANTKTSPRSCGRFRWTTRPGRVPCSTFAGVCLRSPSLSLFLYFIVSLLVLLVKPDVVCHVLLPSDQSCVSARRSFNEFLAEAGKDAEDFPKTLDEVSKAGIRLTLADATDPDGVGFVQWRVAFYVAGGDGSVLNFFNLFDDFLVWKSKAMAKDIEAHLYAHIGVDGLEQSKIEEQLNYEHYTVHDPAQESELPLKWHEAVPCMGKRVATCHLTAASDTALKLIWSGNTWAFRDAMDDAGIKGSPCTRRCCAHVFFRSVIMSGCV